jgi:hypothetical protein
LIKCQNLSNTISSSTFCAIILQNDVLCNYAAKFNRIGGVMVSGLASSAVDREFEPRSGQTKDYKIGICCISAINTALRRMSKD